MQGKDGKQNILGHDAGHRIINQSDERDPCRQTGQIELIDASPRSVKDSKIAKLISKFGERLPGQEVTHLCRVTCIRPFAELQFRRHR
ncbi:hypothetical protein D3C78_1074100 [compost metagenome]